MVGPSTGYLDGGASCPSCAQMVGDAVYEAVRGDPELATYLDVVVVEQRREADADVAEAFGDRVGDPVDVLPPPVRPRQLDRHLDRRVERQLPRRVAVAEVRHADAEQPDPGPFEPQPVEQLARRRRRGRGCGRSARAGGRPGDGLERREADLQRHRPSRDLGPRSRRPTFSASRSRWRRSSSGSSTSSSKVSSAEIDLAGSWGSRARVLARGRGRAAGPRWPRRRPAEVRRSASASCPTVRNP
jgi:hypothetical protein